jgi:predicted RNase H-like nuclease (RuvC/YqgF family)
MSVLPKLTEEQYRSVLKDFEETLSQLKEENKVLKEENVRLRKILYEIHSKVSPFD